jgi:hypothetical protein
MKILLLIFASIISSISANAYKHIAFKADTSVASRIITNELPGSALRKRAAEYFIVAGKDTTFLNCYFIESKDGSVEIDLADHFINSKQKLAYSEYLEDLKLILSTASRNFNFNRLHNIFLGRLVRKGDLAIVVTNQYFKKLGTNTRKIDYKKTCQFLTHSKMGDDINFLFKKYGIRVDNVSLEHPFFTTKNELLSQSKIRTELTQVPSKIFDSLVWLELKPIKTP